MAETRVRIPVAVLHSAPIPGPLAGKLTAAVARHRGPYQGRSFARRIVGAGARAATYSGTTRAATTTSANAHDGIERTATLAAPGLMREGPREARRRTRSRGEPAAKLCARGDPLTAATGSSVRLSLACFAFCGYLRH
jgi:hypothetical protein